MAYIDKITAINSSTNESEVFDIKDTVSGYTTNTGTITGVTAGSGLSGGGTSGSVTLNHSNSVTAKTTQAIYPIKFDSQGHITGAGSAVTIPTVPTNVSAFTNDAGYITEADIPEGASAYTGTPSAVSTTAAKGTSNAFARGDHVHNITDSTIVDALGYTPYDSTNPNGYTSNIGTVTGVKINGSTKSPSSGIVDLGTVATSDTNTTYSLSNALSSHKFTSTLTAGGSGSGTSTATIELAAGTGITLTDDTSNKKITIASSVTNTDTKLQVAEVTSGSTYYPIVGSGITAATRQYDTNGFVYKGTNGTTSTVGTSILTLGNSTASGTAKNKRGQLVIFGSTVYAHTIQGNPTTDRTITLPDATGTVALTSDIPTKTSDLTNDSGYITSYTDTKNTAGSTNTSSKIFLVGATSQATNPTTYSHDTAYVGTDGKLYSASKVVLVGGSNASSSVTITPTTTDVYSMTSAGSVTAGTAASYTQGTFSKGTLPTMTWAMDATDTKQLNITFSQGTLPSHASDTFTANKPTAVTLPGRSSSAIKAWTGYSAATAAAQAFTGVTG